MFLFFGVKKRSELPFAYEIEQLQNTGLLTPFIAYSNEPGVKKKYVQDVIEEEANVVLDLLHNSTTRIYVCGGYAMESGVREVLILLLAKGNDSHPGLGVTRAIERLSLYKTTKKYTAEVYGTVKKNDDKIMEATWKTALEKASRAQASLRKVRIPLPPYDKRDDYHVGSDPALSDDRPYKLDRITATHSNWNNALTHQSSSRSSSFLRLTGNRRGKLNVPE